MDSFKKVFYAIKKSCRDTVDVINTNICFERINEDLNIDRDNFFIYLNILQNMRLINHDKEVITLTELGRKIDMIPSTLT